MQNTIIETIPTAYKGGLFGKSNKTDKTSYNETEEKNEVKPSTIQKDEFMEKESNDFVKEITMTLENANSIEECANKIADLKTGSFNDWLKIGSILHEFKNTLSENVDKNFVALLKDKRVNLNKSQGYKYANVYEFCVDKKEIFHTTGKIQECGIEKIYLIAKFKNKNQQNDLIIRLLNEKLSVTQLKHVIELLNQNVAESVDSAFEYVTSAIKNKNLSEKLIEWGIGKPKVNTNLEDEVNRLKQEIELLKKQLAEYKETEKITNQQQP